MYPGYDMTLPNPRETREERLEIEDLGSSNGTAINGNPMVGALGLLDGDLVSFGSATCLVKRVG